MKFVHTSDLHIGKSVRGVSMLDDQRFILDRILSVIKDSDANALVIAGDIYDRNVPNEGAVDVFDSFLSSLHAMGCPAYIIPGNHDSAKRLSFGSGILKRQGVHIANPFSGKTEKITVIDEHGDLDIHLLPYFKPSQVRHAHPDAEIGGMADAVRCILDASNIDPGRRNLLVTHLFALPASGELEYGGSEEQRSVGGVDCVPSQTFSAFDYVALGHIHKPQRIASNAHYCGSPLKYSESEYLDNKSVLVVDVPEKGNVSVERVPLKPMRDLRVIEGTVDQLKDPSVLGEGNPSDYVYVRLTEDTVDAKAKLASAYPNILHIEIVRQGGDAGVPEMTLERIRGLEPEQLFRELYESMNGAEIPEAEEKIFRKALETAMEESR